MESALISPAAATVAGIPTIIFSILIDYMSLILLDRKEEETIGTHRTWFTRME